MRPLALLASAATAALAASLAAAQAQQAPGGGRDQPAAGAAQRTAPGSDDADRRGAPSAAPQRATKGDSERSGGSGRATVGRGAGAQESPQRGENARTPQERSPQQRSTTGAQPRTQQQSQSEEPRSRGAESPQRGGQAQDRAAAPQRPAPARREGAAEERRERATTGRSGEPSRNEGERSGTAREERARSERQAERSAQRGELRLSGEQRERVTTRFSTRIESMDVRPVARRDINVTIGIGAIVPASVRFYPVPADVIAIYPQFRGHRFVLVEDEIVIVEPRSRRVVAVLPHSGRAAARGERATTGAASAGVRIRLSPQERETIRTVVLRERICRIEQRLDFSIGIPLPRTIEVCEFPQEVVAAVPAVRPFRFVVREDDVVIVDSDRRRVVEVID
jgi:hypothetical protein